MRKVLSFVLVLALVLGSFSMAFAVTPTDVVGTDYSKSVQVLSGLGVVTGFPDGTYKPAQAVTRAEMAKLIVTALGLEDYAVGTSAFKDMTGAAWAQGYVNYAATLGIILGYPDGTFKPSQTVSYDEAAAMILRALGYTDSSLLPATWPANYVIKAKALGILKDVTAKAGGADRGDVAIMLYNALPLKMGAVDKEKGIWVATDPEDKMITRLGATGPTTVNITAGMVGDEDYTLVDLSSYVYADLSVYKDTDGVIIAIASEKTDSLTGEYTTGASITSSFITLADDTDVTLGDTNWDATDKMYLNGGEIAFGAVGAVANKLSKGYDVTVYGYLNDAETSFTTVNGIVAWAPTDIFQATSNDVKDITDALAVGSGTVYNTKLPTVKSLGKALDMGKISVVGAATKLADIKADDVVYVYAAANSDTPTQVKFEVVRNSKDIKVTSKSSTKVFDGTTAYGFPALNIDVASKAVYADFVLDDTNTVWLGNDGKILFREYVSGATNSYGILVATSTAASFGTTTTLVKIFTAAGEKVVYDIDWVAPFVAASLNAITAGGLVEYSLDSDGLVNSIVIGNSVVGATTALRTYDARTGVIGGLFVASDVVAFNRVVTTDPSITSLTDDIVLDADARYILNSDGKIAAIAYASTTGGSASDKYFAVNEIQSVLDGTSTIYKLIGLRAGVDFTAYTNFTANLAISAAPAVYTVTYSGVTVTTVAAISSTLYGIDTASSTVIDTTSGSGFGLVPVSSDVVVYFEVYDTDSTTVPDHYVAGSITNVGYKDVVRYVTDSYGEIIVLVVTQRADVHANPSGWIII